MKLKQYVVDAFADRVFTGNPAAVCVTEAELSEAAMLAVARENNLSETAFARRLGGSYALRWFTPGGEIDLCGHATLATAFVITNYYDPAAQTVDFDTMSGRLSVKRSSGLYEMDFPAYELRRTDVTDEMERALGTRPLEAYIGRDLLCVLPGEAEVRQLKPDLELVSGLDGLLVHVTACGSAYDCVSRSFAPKLCVDEDRSAVPATATSRPTGRNASASPSFGHTRPRAVEASFSAASPGKGSVWRETQCSTPNRSSASRMTFSEPLKRKPAAPIPARRAFFILPLSHTRAQDPRVRASPRPPR